MELGSSQCTSASCLQLFDGLDSCVQHGCKLTHACKHARVCVCVSVCLDACGRVLHMCLYTLASDNYTTITRHLNVRLHCHQCAQHSGLGTARASPASSSSGPLLLGSGPSNSGAPVGPLARSQVQLAELLAKLYISKRRCVCMCVCVHVRVCMA